MSQFTENASYFFPLGVQNIVQIAIALPFSSNTPNCPKLQNKSHAAFLRPFQIILFFYELRKLPYHSFSNYIQSCDNTFTIALNNSVSALQQYYKPLPKIHNWQAQPSYSFYLASFWGAIQ